MDKGLSSQSYCFNSSHVRMWELDYKETECQRIDAFSPYVKNWLIGKDSDAGKDWRQEEKEIIEDETVGCHHQQDRHEFEQALDVGDGQGSLVWCSPWGCKRVGHDLATELNWTESYYPVNPLLDVYLKEFFFFLNECRNICAQCSCIALFTIAEIESESCLVVSDSLQTYGL